MGFLNDLKKQVQDIGRKKVELEIISGANQIFTLNKKKAIMSETATPGEVTFGRNLNFYFMGIDRDRSSTRNVGKTAVGTLVGTALLPGVGTVIGAAIGAKKKDNSIAELDLINIETKQIVTLVVKCDEKKLKELSGIRLSSYKEESVQAVSVISSADELIKYKALLDSGVINQDEFDAKKKELLN